MSRIPGGPEDQKDEAIRKLDIPSEYKDYYTQEDMMKATEEQFKRDQTTNYLKERREAYENITNIMLDAQQISPNPEQQFELEFNKGVSMGDILDSSLTGKLTQEGIDLIKEFEGFRSNAYQDSVGVWTVGYGHTSMAGGLEVGPGTSITRDQADALFIKTANKFEKYTKDALGDTFNDLAPNEFSALVSLVYNIGPGNFRKSNTLKRLRQGDKQGAANAILGWNKAGGRVLKGLTRRRQRERELFLGV